MNLDHALMALFAICQREVSKFVHQRGRLLSSIVRPALWLFVFAVAFQQSLERVCIPPYDAPITYQEYLVPGLLGIVLLFNGMQSSLSMVYDREMGVMRLLLTSPLPRWYLLLIKLMAGTVLSVLQAYVFLFLCFLFGISLPWLGLISVLPALLLGAMSLGAIGLALSVYVKQLENFAGTMNFVIFPLFFVSSALYPLQRFADSGADTLHLIAQVNPFTHAVELIRFAFYGQFQLTGFLVVIATLVVFFALSVWGYDPQRGMAKKTRSV